MIDHIPGNMLEYLTPRNFGISDSAEAFVFLSGLSVGFTYLRKAERHGMRAVMRAALARAFRIYGIHLGLTLGALLIFGAGYWLCGLPDLIEAHGRDLLFHEPGRGVAGVILLSHQLGYFNILPLYVLLMLASPAMIALARMNKLMAFSVSLGLYVAAGVFGLHLPNWPQPGGWFFNPFAWQLLFMLGVLAAMEGRESARWRPRRRCASLAWASWPAGAVVMTDMLDLMPGLYARAFAFFDVGKQNLGIARLVYFLALAYAISTTSGLTRIANLPATEALRRLGRHSLQVFAFGSLLSAIGQALLADLNLHLTDANARAFAACYTLASIGMLFVLAKFLEAAQTQPERAAGQFAAQTSSGVNL